MEAPEQEHGRAPRTLEILLIILFLGVGLGAAIGALFGLAAGAWPEGAVIGTFLALVVTLGLEAWINLSAYVLALEAGGMERSQRARAPRSRR